VVRVLKVGHFHAAQCTEAVASYIMKHLLIVILFSFIPSFCLGYETDQFTTPPNSLADIGEDLSVFLMTEIYAVIGEIKIEKEKLNDEIKDAEKKYSTSKSILDQEELSNLKAKYNRLETPSHITQLIGLKLGETIFWQEQLDCVFGLPFSIFPYPDNLKNNLAITYTSDRFNTIYTYSGFHRLISSSYFVFCSTIRVFDVYFGVDKLGHIFNQGIEYYQMYQQAITENKTREAAFNEILDDGMESENMWFGLLVDGVYSNADLAANMAGFYFYKNLFEELELNGVIYPPLFVLQHNSKIVLNSKYNHNEKEFISKFFNYHLNEAFNPSHIEAMQREIIRSAIKKRCENIITFYHIENKRSLKETMDSLLLWNNMPYGHNSEDLVRLDETCF
jgi:hypothetical protein